MRAGASAGLGVDGIRFGFVHPKCVCSCWEFGLSCIFFQGSWGRRGLLLRPLLELISAKADPFTCPNDSCVCLLELCDEFLDSFSALVNTI